MQMANNLLAADCLKCSVRGPRSFCGLPAIALQELQRMGVSQHLGSRAVVLREGFSAGKVFLVCSGRLKISVSSSDGRLLILRIAGPGDALGLASLLSGSRYSTTVETLEPCTLKAIPRDDFLRFMEAFSYVRRNTSISVAREYEAALLSARRLALSTSAAAKLANALLELAHMAHPNGTALAPPTPSPLASTSLPSQPLDFSLPLTHEEIGCMAGISRETVTRLFSKFRRERLLRQKGENVTLIDPNRLDTLYCV